MGKLLILIAVTTIAFMIFAFKLMQAGNEIDQFNKFRRKPK